MTIDEMIKKAAEYAHLADTTTRDERRLLFAEIAQALAQTAQATIAAERWHAEQAAANERGQDDLDALQTTLAMFRAQERTAS